MVLRILGRWLYVVAVMLGISASGAGLGIPVLVAFLGFRCPLSCVELAFHLSGFSLGWGRRIIPAHGSAQMRHLSLLPFLHLVHVMVVRCSDVSSAITTQDVSLCDEHIGQISQTVLTQDSTYAEVCTSYTSYDCNIALRKSQTSHRCKFDPSSTSKASYQFQPLEVCA